MKILMLTPYLPYPPDSGGQIRTLNLLKYLSRTNDITLVALYKNEKDKKYTSALEVYCKKIYLCKRPTKPWQPDIILKSVFSFIPFLIVRNYSVEANEVINHLLKTEKYDAIHAETFYIMPHIPITKVPILLVEQTIEFMVYQHFISTLPWFIRWAFWVDTLKLKFWEIFYWKKAQLVATVSASDKQVIQTCVPNNETYIIPNGAGDEMFVKSLPEKDLKKPTLLFVGNFSWLQNTEAVEYLMRKVFPKIQKLYPNIELIIAGQNVSTKLTYSQKENIKIIDIKPDDSITIKELYKSCTIFIAPIFGPGGTRLKILAAMAAGLPVISTQTGIEGMDVSSGHEVIVANKEDEFVNAVKRLLSNPALYKSMQEKAFTLVKEKYSWKEIAKKLEMIYKKSTEIVSS